VTCVVVLGLRGVLPAIQGYVARIEKHTDWEEGYELALVANLFAEQPNVEEVKPGVSVWIGDGFKGLVREHVVGRVNQLTIGSVGPRTATRYALEGFDTIEHMPDVMEGYAAMVSTEKETIGNVGRVALREGRVKTFVLSGNQKNVEQAAITPWSVEKRSHRMDDNLHVNVRQRLVGGGVSHLHGKVRNRVAIIRRAAYVLIRHVNEIALAQITQESTRIPPAGSTVEQVLLC
jgi:hypothetical protein